MTERPEVLQRAIHALRSMSGTPDEVSALAMRLSQQLSAPAVAPQRAAAAPRGLTRVWIASGIALVGAGAFYTMTFRSPRHAEPAPILAPAAQVVEPVPAVVSMPEPEPGPTPAAVKVTPKRVLRKRAATSGVSAAAAPVVSAELELGLIGQAQAALDRTPTQALALTAQHARDYPRGLFVEEREMIAIEAELKLRRSSAASERARRFLTAFPRSTHARKVRTLVERGHE